MLVFMFPHRSIPRLPPPLRAAASAVFLALLASLALTRAWAQDAPPANVTLPPVAATPANITSTAADAPANTTAAPDVSSAAGALEAAVSLQLANAHDPAALYSELWALPDQQSVLFLGFGTPDGRAFLLQKIGDPAEPHDHRVALAEALRVDGPIFQSKFTDITPTSWGVKGSPDAKNSSYFTRIAQLALANAGDEELSLALLQSLNWLATGNTANRDPEIQADWNDAADVLQQFYTQTKSERLRYAIEQVAAQIGDLAYVKLGSRSGPLLSMVTQAAKYQPPAVPGAVTTGPAVPPRVIDLLVNYDYQLLPGADKITSAVIVLEPVPPGPPVVFPQRVLPIDLTKTSGSGSIHLILPPKFTRGQYRVYFLFLADQDVVSAGHGVTAQL